MRPKVLEEIDRQVEERLDGTVRGQMVRELNAEALRERAKRKHSD